ncbi:CDP-glycerol glycerophosphotransferase family protein [Ruminobacter amylophilus]|uniref:CDP-glycerol glycerophosphotransferase family protein n=1 Tax=Ruminobacter amylophilus TaxID=867 RepID=UPI00386C13DE
MKLFHKNINYFSSNVKIIISKITFFSLLNFLLFIFLLKNFSITKSENKFIKSQNKYFIKPKSLDYFKLFDIRYLFSFKFKIIKVEYNIEFYENNNNPILPSDLTLYKSLHIFCHFESINSNIIINSFPIITNNKYFKCIEFFNIDEITKYGIQIYEINNLLEVIDNNHIINLFSGDMFNYLNLFNKNDKQFEPLIVNKKYLFYKTQKYINNNFKLQKSFTRIPKCFLKRDLIVNDNEWRFENLYNEYFCFCKDLNSLKVINSHRCKYYFYLNLINKNEKVYLKTDYLFIDFIFKDLSFDDAYPIFKEMIKNNSPVHYLTESSDIYKEYCYKINKCENVILVNRQNYTINGDFLEKYLTLILKLKQVISNSGIYFDYINNLFYNIDYIIYISITHGVCYFKYFLYKENKCYGSKKIDKILMPPSEIILPFAIKLGWKSENIIKLNLPKWDKYNEQNNSKSDLKNISYNNSSILIMFTWREIIRNKQISSYYFQNIVNLILNKKLNQELNKNNITLYFALHHKIYNNFKYIFERMKYIKFIEINKIVDYIKISSLFITDFSSIIFDFIYRRKPFIIFIPDNNDALISDNYKKYYIELIQSIKNGTIEFENKFFDIDSVVNKIIFYLKNNFQLDDKLIKLYDSLNIKQKANNINEFINYIKNLKIN